MHEEINPLKWTLKNKIISIPVWKEYSRSIMKSPSESQMLPKKKKVLAWLLDIIVLGLNLNWIYWKQHLELWKTLCIIQILLFLLALREKISSFSTCYFFMLYTCNINSIYARYDMNIYCLINEYVFYVHACLQFFCICYWYMLIV